MIEQKRYSSYSFDMFTVWKMTFLILLFPGLLIFLLQLPAYILLVFLAVLTVVISYYILNSYSEISIVGKTLTAKDYSKTLVLESIEDITTWWSYEFGVGSPEMNMDGPSGKSQALINKIRVFAKFKDGQEEIVLCEEIFMGSKFPNNYNYSIDEVVDIRNLVMVRDIDKCLKKLQITKID